MGVGPMNLVITNDALYQLSYTSEPFMTLTASTGYIILSYADICKDFFFDKFYFFCICPQTELFWRRYFMPSSLSMLA